MQKLTLFKKKFASKKLSLKQTTGLSISQLLCTVSTTPAVSLHSTCYENHGSSTIIIIRNKLRILDQGVMSIRFWPNKVKC